MRMPVHAILVETTNPSAVSLRGRSGELFLEMGVRCVFEGLITSVVEGIVWFGARLEVHTRGSKYVFEVATAARRDVARPGAAA